jgi:hypothetical protein
MKKLEMAKGAGVCVWTLDRKQKDVRVKLLGVVLLGHIVCVCCLFVYGAVTPQQGASSEPHSIQSNGVADDRLLLRHCRSFGLGEGALEVAAWRWCARYGGGGRKGMMNTLLGVDRCR